MSLIRVRDLELCYGRKREKEFRVGPLNFEIASGSSFGLIGESGAGKSTVGFEILGLLKYRGGQRIGGEIESSVPPDRMAYIPQDPASALDPLFSVGSQLAELGANRLEIDAALDQARLSLKSVSLKSYPHELSGGMRQRLVIAMALLRRPQLIIADEPTSSLDVSLQAEIMMLFEAIRKTGITFLFITHNLPLAAQFCDWVAVMRYGRIVEQGAAKEIFFKSKNPYLTELVRAVPVLYDE